MPKVFRLIIPTLLLIFALSFNLYFLFSETKIKSEVNDNVFAFGLINRMNVAWDEGKCPFSATCLPSLLDHWNSQWAMGFPLPHFYQHIPDLAVVITYRFLGHFASIPLWDVFQWFKYLMLSFIPLSYFISAKKFGFNNLASAFTALVSTQVSTQYLYGTDLNALIWRGSGMYTQLWGIFFLPLAVSSVYEFLTKEKRTLFQPVLFLSLAISSHVVFGFLALGSSALLPVILALSENPLTIKKIALKLISLYKKILSVFIFTFLIISYWLIPLLTDSVFRNKSIWDDINKFDSFGFAKIIKWFLNGELFDANRPPVLTIIVIVGLFLFLYLWFKSKENKKEKQNPLYLLFPLLFFFWLALYFGRKTWGSVIDIIPLMEDMHIHRLINGVHFAGIFMIGLGAAYIVENLKMRALEYHKNGTSIRIPAFNLKIPILVIFLLLLIPVFKERKEYMEYNSKLMVDYNKFWATDNKDFQKVLDFLGPPPTVSRIYPGRPGNWGNDFYVGTTKVYLELSERGYDVFEFLPETWSLNSDIEQYFDENNQVHFNTFNVGYYLAPKGQKVPSFAKQIFESGKYVLYKIDSAHNFALGESPLVMNVNKKTFLNPQIIWLRSKWPENFLFPTIAYNQKTTSANTHTKSITLIDNTSYSYNGDYFPILSTSPFVEPTTSFTPNGKVENEKVTPSSYSATVANYKDSVLQLKVTYNPYWKAYINGKPTEIYMSSPSFMSIYLPTGTNKVEFIYTPSKLKISLIYISLVSLFCLLIFSALKNIIMMISNKRRVK